MCSAESWRKFYACRSTRDPAAGAGCTEVFRRIAGGGGGGDGGGADDGRGDGGLRRRAETTAPSEGGEGDAGGGGGSEKTLTASRGDGDGGLRRRLETTAPCEEGGGDAGGGGGSEKTLTFRREGGDGDGDGDSPSARRAWSRRRLEEELDDLTKENYDLRRRLRQFETDKAALRSRRAGSTERALLAAASQLGTVGADISRDHGRQQARLLALQVCARRTERRVERLEDLSMRLERALRVQAAAAAAAEHRAPEPAQPDRGAGLLEPRRRSRAACPEDSVAPTTLVDLSAGRGTPAGAAAESPVCAPAAGKAPAVDGPDAGFVLINYSDDALVRHLDRPNILPAPQKPSEAGAVRERPNRRGRESPLDDLRNMDRYFAGIPQLELTDDDANFDWERFIRNELVASRPSRGPEPGSNESALIFPPMSNAGKRNVDIRFRCPGHRSVTFAHI